MSQAKDPMPPAAAPGARPPLFTPRFFMMCGFTFTVFLSFFQLLPLQVRSNVFKGVMIYCSDKGKAYDAAIQTFNEYRLFRPLYLQVIG